MRVRSSPQRLTELIERLGRETRELEQRAAALRAKQATARATLTRHRETAATARRPAARRSPMGEPVR
jgi:hypothetical protein